MPLAYSTTGRDQKSILESSLMILKDRNPKWNDLTENNQYYMIMEAVSHVIAGYNFRIDQYFLELNPKTAQTEQGKTHIISSFGGSLSFFEGSYGYIQISLKSDYRPGNSIPFGTKVDVDGTKYYIDEDILIGTSGLVKARIRQGEIKKISYTKNDIINNQIRIPDSDTVDEGVCLSSIRMYNQGNWERVKDIYFEYRNLVGGENNRIFSVTKTFDRFPIIQLDSDWESWLNPLTTGNFDVTYSITRGGKHNFGLGLEVKVEHPLSNYAVTITDIKGGSSPDYSLDKQLRNAVEYIRTMDTAISIDDFSPMIRSIPDVFDAIAYDIDSDKILAIDDYLTKLKLEKVKGLDIVVSAIDFSTSIPNKLLEDRIIELLKEKSLSIFNIRYVPPLIVEVDYNIEVKFSDSSHYVSYDEIKNTVVSLFDKPSFGNKLIGNSKIVSEIHNISPIISSVEVKNTTSSPYNPFSFYKIRNILVTSEVI